jgi:hypothetical protein
MGLPETAVTRRAETLDDVLAQRLGTPTGRLLDRLDAAIISIGRGIWRLVVDGLVARGLPQVLGCKRQGAISAPVL